MHSCTNLMEVYTEGLHANEFFHQVSLEAKKNPLQDKKVNPCGHHLFEMTSSN